MTGSVDGSGKRSGVTAEVVLRARRAVVGGAEVARRGLGRGRTHRRGRPLRHRGARRPRGRAGRRRGAAPRPRRRPRARQRAGPHRLGGLRQRHPGRGGRWRHDDHRHAAQLDPADGDRGGPRGEAGRRPRPGLRRRGVLGRCRARQPARPATAARGGRLRVQVLPAPLRRRRVPPPVGGRAARGARRDRDLRRPRHRARRGRATPSTPRRSRTARGMPGSWVHVPRRPRSGPSPRSSTRRARPVAGRTSCTCPTPTPSR